MTARPIEDWMEHQTGKSVREIRIADLMALPRRRGLKYATLRSRLGGRLDRHLKHLTDEEVIELLKRGDQFLDETPSEPAAGQS
jgi:hypothetical protein